MDEVAGRVVDFRYSPGQRAALNAGIAAAVGVVVVITLVSSHGETGAWLWSMALEAAIGALAACLFGRAKVVATRRGLGWHTAFTRAFASWSDVRELRPIQVGMSRRVLVETNRGTWILPVPNPLLATGEFETQFDEINRCWIAGRNPLAWPPAEQPFEPSRTLEGVAVLRTPLMVRLSSPLAIPFSSPVSIALAGGSPLLAVAFAGLLIGGAAWHNRTNTVQVTDTEVIISRLGSSQRIRRESIDGITEIVSSGRRHLAFRTDGHVVNLTAVATNDTAGLVADPQYYRKWAWLQHELFPAHSPNA